MYQPVLLYTTEEHGCSLTTFYVRVEQHEPTLLMIKTCNNEVGKRQQEAVREEAAVNRWKEYFEFLFVH